MITESQMPSCYKEIIDDEIKIFKEKRSVTNQNSIPDTPSIPIENATHWLKIPDVVCIFVDMLGSTKLSANQHDRSTAGAYRLFTSTAVRLFSEFESPYIDVRGDGVFALFDSDQVYRAIAAAITFKTFAHEEFVPRIKEKTKVEIGCHIGIDQKVVLVRKIGFKRYRGRTDRQNEVWAGKPVNMASKLSSHTKHNELLVSDRYFEKLKDELVLKSCGCPSGEKADLWAEVDISEDSKFDFDKAYMLRSHWCGKHGKEYCENILKLDGEKEKKND